MAITALLLLIGDGRKFAAMVCAVAFASLLVCQQAGIFLGVMALTYGPIDDAPRVELWIADPRLRHLENLATLNDRDLDTARSCDGIAWVSPTLRSQALVDTGDGGIESCTMIGLDDATLAGAPEPGLVDGCTVDDLRRPWTVLVDAHAATGKLAIPLPDGTRRPLRSGDELVVGGQRLTVAGTCRTAMSLMQMPTLYLRRSHVQVLAMAGGASFNLIYAGVESGRDPGSVAEAVRASTGLAAFTAPQLRDSIYDYFLYNTGIPANFAIAVLLGFAIGAAIAGQTYHQFLWDNRRIFATFLSMGLSHRRLLALVSLQTAVVGLIGYGLGVGGAVLMGHALDGTDLAFRVVPALLLVPFAAVLGISAASAATGMRALGRMSPSDVFRSL